MNLKKGPFRADIVGSFLRTETLKNAREDFFNNIISKDELRSIEDIEIKKLIAKEKEMGLKVVTDGEFRRRWWHLDFISELNGISVFDFESEAFGVKSTMQSTFVSGKLSFNEEHSFLKDFKYTLECAGNDTVAKQTIPGPNMIYGDAYLLSAKYRENPCYSSAEDFKHDLIKTYQDAIASFYNAGCRYLQLDDTCWGSLFDARFREKYISLGHNPDELIAEFGYITREALKYKPEDMTITFHFCKGNFRSHWLYSGSYEKISKNLLSINFDGFFLEFDDERSGNFEPLSDSIDQKIVLGLITSKAGKLEYPEYIKSRINEASKIVPLERLCLSTQCGFSSTEEGNSITEEEQWNKIKLVVDIAKEVWNVNSSL